MRINEISQRLAMLHQAIAAYGIHMNGWSRAFDGHEPRLPDLTKPQWGVCAYWVYFQSAPAGPSVETITPIAVEVEELSRGIPNYHEARARFELPGGTAGVSSGRYDLRENCWVDRVHGRMLCTYDAGPELGLPATEQWGFFNTDPNQEGVVSVFRQVALLKLSPALIRSLWVDWAKAEIAKNDPTTSGFRFAKEVITHAGAE